jgi:uncharacterized protein (DUF2147 family)
MTLSGDTHPPTKRAYVATSPLIAASTSATLLSRASNRREARSMFRAVGLALALVPAIAFAQSAEGLWRTEPSKSGAWLEVSIAPCGAALCGTITGQHGTTKDLVGRRIIDGMKPDGPGRWSGGTIWAPDDDKTYRSKMSLDGDGLAVEGCVAIFCRGQRWTRLE